MISPYSPSRIQPTGGTKRKSPDIKIPLMGEEEFTPPEMYAAHLTDKDSYAEHTKIKQQQKRTPKK